MSAAKNRLAYSNIWPKKCNLTSTRKAYFAGHIFQSYFLRFFLPLAGLVQEITANSPSLVAFFSENHLLVFTIRGRGRVTAKITAIPDFY